MQLLSYKKLTRGRPRKIRKGLLLPFLLAMVWLNPTALISAPADEPAGALEPGMPNRPPIIRKITIVAQDVFDPGATFPLAGLANALHFRTRTQTIRQELLFREHELYNQLRIDETERNLRALGFLAEVAIESQPTGGDSVDLIVWTKDKWSTRLTSSYRLEGNVHYLGVGLIEDNLIGLGKAIDFSYNHSSERILRQVQWNDPNLLGTRLTNRIKYQNNSDGRLASFGLGRPFYSWQSKWGFKLNYERIDGIFKQYLPGQVIEHDMQDRLAQLSTSLYWGYGVKRHLMLGAIREKFRVGKRQRKYNLIGAGLGWLQRNYLEARNVDSFDMIEDIPYGYLAEFAVAINYQDQSHTFHKPYFLSRLAWASANEDNYYFSMSSRLQTFFDQHRASDLVSENELKLFKRFGRQLWVARLSWSQVVNSGTYNQLTLGDENGLRGFPLHSRSGSKMLLFNLENRIRTRVKFYFIRLGFTAFLDLGEVWERAEPVDLTELKSAFGLGLRIGNDKYASGIARIDLAFNTSEQKFRLSISTRSYFSAFSALNFMNDFNLDKLR